jgi:hypothetical protein
MRRARKPMASSLREREQRRTRDPLPAQLLKYLRVRPRPSEGDDAAAGAADQRRYRGHR